MLPNFRRTDAEPPKLQTAAESPTLPAFQPPPRSAFLPVTKSEPSRNVSIIGADLTIAGNLICKGEVQVDGVVEGDIEGSNVVIGEGAVVTGNIAADEVIVRGHVIGTVHGRRVMLQTTSQVEGDVFHQSLSIEQGAMFEGKSRRSNEDPRTLLKRHAETAEPSQNVTLAFPPRLPGLQH